MLNIDDDMLRRGYKGESKSPFTTADVCWCEPFEGPIHPECPMHRLSETQKERSQYAASKRYPTA